MAKDYTWHHVHDFDPITGETTMQLVEREAHAVKAHKGSVLQFKSHFGLKEYTKRGGAVEKAKQLGVNVCR